MIEETSSRTPSGSCTLVGTGSSCVLLYTRTAMALVRCQGKVYGGLYCIRRYDFPLGSSVHQRDDEGEDDLDWRARSRESSCLATSPSVAKPCEQVWDTGRMVRDGPACFVRKLAPLGDNGACALAARRNPNLHSFREVAFQLFFVFVGDEGFGADQTEVILAPGVQATQLFRPAYRSYFKRSGHLQTRGQQAARWGRR